MNGLVSAAAVELDWACEIPAGSVATTIAHASQIRSKNEDEHEDVICPTRGHRSTLVPSSATTLQVRLRDNLSRSP